MIKKISIFFAGLALSAVLPLTALAQTATVTTEEIVSYNVDAHVHTDSSVDVVERIDYDFGTADHHGIFRYIPVSYDAVLGNQSISLSDIKVTDEVHKPYAFTVSFSGKDEIIKIGDADKLVSGLKTYIISYTVSRAIGYFSDRDEFYWNATGNGWTVPIAKATATVYLPKNIQNQYLHASCYYGPLGNTGQCSSNIATSTTYGASSASFAAPHPLAPGEGLTVALGFPKGVVIEPTAFENFFRILADNWIAILPLLVFIFMTVLWNKKGRDPKGTGTVIPQYESPENLLPIEVAEILRQGIDGAAISSEIISLATRGYIKITRLEDKGIVFAKVDYALLKLKEADPSLPEFDKKILEALFSIDGADGVNTIKISELKNHFFKNLPAIKKSVAASSISKGYYEKDPQKVMGMYVAIGIAFGVLGVFLFNAIGFTGVVPIVSVILSGIIICVFATIMPALTEAGALVRERILGLKMYITVAEKDRINFHNAPEKNPELFEKLLPYAMVFGAEKQWAEQFESIYLTPPSWYNDPSGRAFSAVILSNNISSFSSVASKAVTTAPGGRSGSGGGGFSGGGGGGGGGGSW